MRITFVLPTPIRIPMGGAKVVYGHAERLAARGHTVSVVAPRRGARGVRAWARQAAVAARDTVHGVAGGQAYHATGVETLEIATPASRHFPEADVTVATGVQTAPWVAALPRAKGRGVYFVQGDETFVRPDARETWGLGLPVVTCARWLAEEVEASGADVRAVVPNALDEGAWGVDRPLAERPARVVALYHRHPVKGPDVLLEALAHLRRQRPGLAADVFCARPPSHRLPPWVGVHVRPLHAELRALYNGAGVLLHPSRSEGSPLVPLEAAACGCAVAASANQGVQEVLEAGVSMATAPVGDGSALGEAADRVLGDPALRQRLVGSAREEVCALDWETSTDVLEATLAEVAR